MAKYFYDPSKPVQVWQTPAEKKHAEKVVKPRYETEISLVYVLLYFLCFLSQDVLSFVLIEAAAFPSGYLAC